MDANKVITAALIRLVEDSELKELISDPVTVYKGAKRTDGAKNPCLTVHINGPGVDPDSTRVQGTLVINHYADNYASGNAKVEDFGPVQQRIMELFHDNPLDIEGFLNYSIAVRSLAGPLWDADHPDEHYTSTFIDFNIVKRSGD